MRNYWSPINKILKEWGIKKDITNKKRKQKSQSKLKFSDNSITSYAYAISENFNDFFSKHRP